jgi:hypothetical protein
MRLPWQRTPLTRLLAAADLTRGTAEIRDDAAVTQRLALTVAYADAPDRPRASDRPRALGLPGADVLTAVLAEAERLLADPAAHEPVTTLLECLQNVVSFGEPGCVTDGQVTAALGPRTTVVWAGLHTFWQGVLTWCDDREVMLAAADDVVGVRNETLRALLITTNRRVSGGRRIGLAHAVRFERATGEGLPGFTHLAAAMAAAGRG